MAKFLELDLTTDIGRAADWSGTLAKQLPFVVSKALNDTAFDARTSLSGATRQYFDRPTTFTQKGFQVERSSKRDLEVAIGAEQKRARYLITEITGGARSQKAFENLFSSLGGLPSGTQMVPTSAIKLDKSGNVSLATLRRIKQGLSSDPRGGFFIGQPRNNPGLPPGIYRRSRLKLTPYFVSIAGQAHYSPRFPMLDVVSKVYERRYGQYFMSALERALATAR